MIFNVIFWANPKSLSKRSAHNSDTPFTQLLISLKFAIIKPGATKILCENLKKNSKRLNFSFNLQIVLFRKGDLNDTEYLDYGTGAESQATKDDLNNACAMYGAMNTQLPYAIIDTMAKLIFEVKSFDEVRGR